MGKVARVDKAQDKNLIGQRFGNLVISKFDDTEGVYLGSLRGVSVKVKQSEDGKIFVNNYCTKCGSEFYYLYTRGKPNLVCENCKPVKAITPVGEVEINGRTFIKYSNGMIRPKE